MVSTALSGYTVHINAVKVNQQCQCCSQVHCCDDAWCSGEQSVHHPTCPLTLIPAWFSGLVLLTVLSSLPCVIYLGVDDFALGGTVTSAHAQNVLYCVGSNFLEVKQLASTLIRQLPPSTVGLQVTLPY